MPSEDARMRTARFAAPLLLLALFVIACPRASRAADNRFTLEIARKLVGVGSPRVSPDGRSIAFLVTKPNFDADRNETELWLADATTGNPRPLTFERRAVSLPQWSPDG